jgi:hypothetical protein
VGLGDVGTVAGNEPLLTSNAANALTVEQVLNRLETQSLVVTNDDGIDGTDNLGLDLRNVRGGTLKDPLVTGATGGGL